MNDSDAPERFIEQVNAIQGKLQNMREAGDRFPTLTEDEKRIMRRFEESLRAFSTLKEDRGRLYDFCSFDNYEIRNDQQAGVVRKLKKYADDVANVEIGRPIILFGPKGTGKDHLLMAIARRMAENYGVCPLWRNGCDLHEILKGRAFAGHRVSIFGETPEREAGILWVSDPLPPTGPLSVFQQSQLFSLIDYRYSNMKSTWMTMNVASKPESEERLGSQTADRLRDKALVLFCNWPSFRAPWEPDK